jgi:dTDP-4-amino-4,6-dideoxygalactose transaminase
MNSRLDELHAALLSIKLPHLHSWVERRREIARRYDARLSPRIRRVTPAEGASHAYHLYVVRVPERDRVRQALLEGGIGTGVHYPHPIHLMRAYSFLGHRPGAFPKAEGLAREVLSLPLFPELLDHEVDEVATALNALCG